MGGQHCGEIMDRSLTYWSKAGTIMFRNNRLTEILRGAARGHNLVNKIIALGEINSKSAAQAEYKILEYLGHHDLLKARCRGCYALCH